MKKTGVVVAALLMVVLLAPSMALGKTHRIQLLLPGVIGGVDFDAGYYKMVLNGDGVAEFYDGKNLMVKAKCEVQPIGSSSPQSVNQNSDGTITEIRLKSEKVILLDSQS